MGYEVPQGKMKPKTPEEVLKEQEYEKGKKLQLPDGSIVTVHSVEKEIQIRKDSQEK
jgi:hypothetical protein